MRKNTTQLRLYFYGKSALEDIKYICKNVDMNLSIDNTYGNKIYVTKDKEVNYEYYIVPDEISEKNNIMIKNFLEEHFKSENSAKTGEAISKATELCKKEANLKDLKDEQSDDDSLYNDNSYNLYSEKLSKKISEILLDHRKFFDVIIFCVDNLSGKDTEIAIKYFQGFTKQMAQPFLFFLTKKDDNPKIIDLFKFVTNEFFDKRNVFAYKFPISDEEIEKINNYFVKCMNYYHEIGNIDINNESETFNMLICGKAGVGKSTFINQFLNEKVAKEGEGLSVTQEITNYRHPKYKIKIFDTPGFENDITVEKVYRTIKKFEKDIKDSRHHLDLVLYFNELKPRTFLELEKRLIKHLIKQKKKLIFVLNDTARNPKKVREYLLDVFKDSIKSIVYTIEKKYKIEADDIINNMVIINLKQSFEEYDEEEYEDEDDDSNNKKEKKTSIKIAQTFGMDKLFKKIYEMLEKHKIHVYDIEKSNNTSDLINKVKKYELLNHIKNIEDIHINIKIESSKLILSYAKYDWFVWFFRDKRRKELLDKINTLNKGDKIGDIESLFIRIKYKVDHISDKEDSKNQFFGGIKKFKGLFKTQGFNFDAYFYNDYTLLIGMEFLKEFQKDYGEYDEKSKRFLTNLSNAFNDAIDDFKKLSDEWKETYKSLNKHYTNKEWVKKFFIVEEPKKLSI